jgi:hypothetical protein
LEFDATAGGGIACFEIRSTGDGLVTAGALTEEPGSFLRWLEVVVRRVSASDDGEGTEGLPDEVEGSGHGF